jgi:pimeloyl-ACP methyl ester carboxylesterase
MPAQLAYEEHGTGSPQLVFVPGWCCDRTLFAPQVEHFRRSHRVVSLDLRGCGASAVADDGYDIPTLADDVGALCDDLGLDRPVIVGHSLGGMIGIELAAARPELVGAVVGVDSGPIDPLPDVRSRFAELAEAIEGEGGDATRRAYVEGLFLAEDDADAKRHVLEVMCAVPARVAAAVLRGVVEWDGVAALRACRAPVLEIRSVPTGSNAPERLLALKPEIEIGVTVGSGHFNQLVVPEQVNAMIERFVSTRVLGIRRRTRLGR